MAETPAQAAELSSGEMVSGVPDLLAKVAHYRPRIVCFVGKTIWEIFCKAGCKLAAQVTIAGDSDITVMRGGLTSLIPFIALKDKNCL